MDGNLFICRACTIVRTKACTYSPENLRAHEMPGFCRIDHAAYIVDPSVHDRWHLELAAAADPLQGSLL